jgi:uncharacterized repeat protein (TIGR03943 family)
VSLNVRNLRIVVLASWSAFLTWLWLSGQVLRYLGPRTSWVVTFGAIALTMATIVYAITSTRSSQAERPVAVGQALASLAMLTPILMAMMLSGSSLGALAAANKLSARGVDLASLAESLSSGDSEVSFLQIRAASDSSETAASLGIETGQQISLTGLVMEPNRAPTAPFGLGRFYITCCVADALPISVSVYPTLVKGRYPKDEWLEVKGALAQRGNRYVVEAESIDPVSEPSNPYLSFR